MGFGIPYCLNNLNNGSIDMIFEGTLVAWLDAVIYRKLRSRVALTSEPAATNFRARAPCVLPACDYAPVAFRTPDGGDI